MDCMTIVNHVTNIIIISYKYYIIFNQINLCSNKYVNDTIKIK